MLGLVFDRAKHKRTYTKRSESFIRQRAQPTNKDIAVLT